MTILREVVPLPTPDIENMIEALERLIVRIKAGEIISVLITAFATDGRILTAERGKRMSRFELIGLLESWKADLLQTMETDLPAGI